MLLDEGAFKHNVNSNLTKDKERKTTKKTNKGRNLGVKAQSEPSVPRINIAHRVIIIKHFTFI